jgi:mono/diheme cytochrome c family protein
VGKDWGLFWCGAAIATLGLFPSTQAGEAADTARVTNPFEGRSDLVEEGRSLFNQYCAHCHAPNAQQGERPRDLRRLKLRYGENAPAVFYATVSNGRLDKGMPVWKGVLSEDTLWRIFTFLETVQTPP